jgi:hypothetical protein
MAALTLTLPKLDQKPAHPPETRLAKVAAWLDDIGRRDPVAAAQLMGDALAATNRVDMTDARRMELAEAYWNAAMQLWPRLERTVLAAPHPLTGPPLEAAKAALTLAQELSTAYKHLLAREAGKRISLGGSRLAGALIHRCLQCFARVLASSYQSYSPVPPYTWLDAHAVYAYARARNLHLNAIPGDAAEATPERIYVQALLLALANPVRLPSGPAPHRARLPADALALGQAHRRRAGPPAREIGRDRARGPRLPAVLGQQGRRDGRRPPLPAHVRPRVPAAGGAARARDRREGCRPTSGATSRRGRPTSRFCSASCANGRSRPRASSTACRRAPGSSCASGSPGRGSTARGGPPASRRRCCPAACRR